MPQQPVKNVPNINKIVDGNSQTPITISNDSPIHLLGNTTSTPPLTIINLGNRFSVIQPMSNSVVFSFFDDYIQIEF